MLSIDLWKTIRVGSKATALFICALTCIWAVMYFTSPAAEAFTACLHNANHEACNVTIIGDSRAVAIDTAEVSAGDLWAELLRKRLQAEYGNGGPGIVPLKWGMRMHDANPHYYKVEGSYTFDGELGPYQPTGSHLVVEDAAVFHLSDGAAVTFSSDMPYSRSDVYCESKFDSGYLSINVDGADRGSACAERTDSPKAHRFSVLAGPALHLAKAICRGEKGCYLYAMGGTMPTGVRVNNMSLGGGSAETLGIARSQFAFAELVDGNPGVSVVEHITNEQGNRINRAYYLRSLLRILWHERKMGNLVIFLYPRPGSIAGQPKYKPIMAWVARFSHSPFIDMQSTPGECPNQKYFRADGAHESSYGNRKIADALEAKLDIAP